MYGQSVEVLVGIPIKTDKTLSSNLSFGALWSGSDSTFVTLKNIKIEASEYAGRELDVEKSFELVFKEVRFGKKMKFVNIYEKELSSDSVLGSNLAVIGDFVQRGFVKWLPSDAVINRSMYDQSRYRIDAYGNVLERQEFELKYLLLENKRGEYFIGAHDLFERIERNRSLTSQAKVMANDLPNSLIYWEKAYVDTFNTMTGSVGLELKLENESFVFTDSDSSTVSELQTINGMSEWFATDITASISCNYNSSESRFDFPVNIEEDFLLYVWTNLASVDKILLNKKVFEFYDSSQSLKWNTEYRISKEELSLAYWRVRVAEKLPALLLDSINIKGLGSEWYLEVDKEFPRWPLVKLIDPTVTFSSLSSHFEPAVNEQLAENKLFSTFTEEQKRKEYSRLIDTELARLRYSPFKKNVIDYYAYKALSSMLYLKSIQQNEEKTQKQADANAELIRQLRRKHGSKFVDAALEGDILVGMPEELLPIPLQFWSISSRDDWSGGYALWCKFRMNTAKKLKVVVNNGKVSRVSTW